MHIDTHQILACSSDTGVALEVAIDVAMIICSLFLLFVHYIYIRMCVCKLSTMGCGVKTIAL